MLLAIDIGNTLTDLGLYDGETLLYHFKTKSDPSKSFEEHQAVFSLFLDSKKLDASKIERAIISSVVPGLTKVWSSIAETITNKKPLVLGPHLRTGLQIKADHPNEVGSDLVADAVGALKKYGPSCVIVDLGTASKVILLDKDGAFSGVSIAPGFSISIEALVNKTAALPEVSLNVPKSVIGKNTEDAMNSGMIYGTAYEVRGLSEAFIKEVGYSLKKILTGGNSSYVKDVLSDFTYDPSLLLDGLFEIDRKNQK